MLCLLPLACTIAFVCRQQPHLCACMPVAQPPSLASTGSHSITASQGPCSCQCTYNWPWSFLPVCLRTHHYICVCNWPLPLLHRNLLLAVMAQLVHTTSFKHYHYLFWSLATGPGDNVENPRSPKSPCRLCGTPYNIHQGPCSCECCGPQWPEPMSHYTPWTYCYYKPLHLGVLHHWAQGHSTL